MHLPDPSPAARPRAGRAAFTLVELLTVVAIVAILAAILIPTIGKIRRSANRASCASNLRQIGTALAGYCADHRNALPGYEKIKDHTGTYYALGRSAGPVWWVEGGQPTRDFVAQLLPYLSITIPAGSTSGVARVMVCPASPMAGDSTPAASYYLGTAVLTTDGTLKRPFAYNGKRSLMLGDIAFPPKAAALFDLDAEILAQLHEGSVAGAPATPVHDDVRNVLYFDGHVSAVTKDTNPEEKL